MKQHKQNQLRQELLQAGAKTAEVKALLPIASRLELLARKQFAGVEATSSRLRFFRPLTVGALGLIIGTFLVIVSQSVLPTSWLYPVQKLSDSVAIDVHPQYRATVMMKRAQQVNGLVAGHSSRQKVLATLADYTNEANAYKALPHANYAAFEFCKSNLEQAASAAPSPERAAITEALTSLQT
jgi:hypothetical protein